LNGHERFVAFKKEFFNEHDRVVTSKKEFFDEHDVFVAYEKEFLGEDDAFVACQKEFLDEHDRFVGTFWAEKGGRNGSGPSKMSNLGDICRPAGFFGCFGQDRQTDVALQDARAFAKTTRPAPPAGLQTSLKCRVEPLARSNTARGRTLQRKAASNNGGRFLLVAADVNRLIILRAVFGWSGLTSAATAKRRRSAAVPGRSKGRMAMRLG
jgi:hypothetical protein